MTPAALKNIPDYLNHADAFCLTSLFEGLPITLIEAMACGCIPVCTPVSGVIDIIRDGETGFISRDFTTDAFKETVERFLENGRDAMKQDLKKLFTNRFSMEICAANYADLYRKKVPTTVN